jgi:hypothetical protein
MHFINFNTWDSNPNIFLNPLKLPAVVRKGLDQGFLVGEETIKRLIKINIQQLRTS